MGKPMIMGRKTFESFGGKPLPGRDHIVISRTPQADESRVFWVRTIDEAIEKAATFNSEEIIIVGGGEIYKQTMSMIDRLYITIVDRDYEGDIKLSAFQDIHFYSKPPTFPKVNWDYWIKTEEKFLILTTNDKDAQTQKSEELVRMFLCSFLAKLCYRYRFQLL